MHPETHLQLHRIRSAELQRQAADFSLRHQSTPPQGLRTRVGWTMVELGLRLIPERPATPSRAPRTA
ncbi:hypothetical protein [Streptomyces sp. NPDC058382]|uniref:hypothetical protein n=1 Tax=unclassified Streptomyces TaxID=2593676 RepID=UPI0036259BE3